MQAIDLAEGDAAFGRLVDGLRRAGLDPDGAFAWDLARSPYPGLAAFTSDDAAVFFGRDAEIRRLIELLQPTLARGAGRWVCIVGPSGSGKSSLLRAGLLPRLARLPERWLVVPPLTPGAHPTRALAFCLSAALARHDRPVSVDELERRLTDCASGPATLRTLIRQLCEAASGERNVLIVLDQAEELVTRTGRREQAVFLRLLNEAMGDDSPLWVVATLRSEFLSTSPERAGLAEIIDDHLVIEPLEPRPAARGYRSSRGTGGAGLRARAG